jgi:hypothetical protein
MKYWRPFVVAGIVIGAVVPSATGATVAHSVREVAPTTLPIRSVARTEVSPSAVPSPVAARFDARSYFTNTPWVDVQLVPASSMIYQPSTQSGVLTLRRGDGTIVATQRLASRSARPSASLTIDMPETFDGTLEFSGDSQLQAVSEPVHVEASPYPLRIVDVTSTSPGSLSVSWSSAIADLSVSLVLESGVVVAPTSIDLVARQTSFDVPPNASGLLRMDGTTLLQGSYNSLMGTGVRSWPISHRRTVTANGHPSPGLAVSAYPRGGTFDSSSTVTASVDRLYMDAPIGSRIDLSIDGVLRSSGSTDPQPLMNSGSRVSAQVANGIHEVTAALVPTGGWNGASTQQRIAIVPTSLWIDWSASSTGVTLTLQRSALCCRWFVPGAFTFDTPSFVGAIRWDSLNNSVSRTMTPTDGHYRIAFLPDDPSVVVEPIEYWVANGVVQGVASLTPGGTMTFSYTTFGQAPVGDTGTPVLVTCTRANGTTGAWIANPIASGSTFQISALDLSNARCSLSIDRGIAPAATDIEITFAAQRLNDDLASTASSVRSKPFTIPPDSVVPIILSVKRAGVSVRNWIIGDSPDSVGTSFYVTVTCQDAGGQLVDPPRTALTSIFAAQAFGVADFPHLTINSTCVARTQNIGDAIQIYRSTEGQTVRAIESDESLPTRAGGTITVENQFLGDLVVGVSSGRGVTFGPVYVACDKGGPKLTLNLRRGERVVVPDVAAGTNCLVAVSAPGAITTTDDNSGGDTSDGRVTIKQRAVGCLRPRAATGSPTGDGSSVTDACAARVSIFVDGPGTPAPVATPVEPSPRSTAPSADPRPTVSAPTRRAPAPSA